MTSDRMGLLIALVGLALCGGVAWKFMSRTAYESAAYQVLKSDGPFELRDYPDLVLVATKTRFEAQGRDGSFMKLFRYISGANEAERKIAMTTPVFMGSESGVGDGRMGFVLPQQVAEAGPPAPVSEDVSIESRQGGRFAVVRFAGVMDSNAVQTQEAKLRVWMESQGLVGVGSAETAGYDPPFIPGPLRRNEVLIRLNGSGD